MRRKFTQEFKFKAIEKSTAEGQSIARCAEELGIPRNTLYRWIAEYSAAPNAAFRGNGNRTEEQKRIRALERENERLARELDRLRPSAGGSRSTSSPTSSDDDKRDVDRRESDNPDSD